MMKRGIIGVEGSNGRRRIPVGWVEGPQQARGGSSPRFLFLLASQKPPPTFVKLHGTNGFNLMQD